MSLLEEIALPTKKLQKFSQRLDAQLARLERKIQKAVPQLSRRSLASRRVSRRP